MTNHPVKQRDPDPGIADAAMSPETATADLGWAVDAIIGSLRRKEARPFNSVVLRLIIVGGFGLLLPSIGGITFIHAGYPKLAVIPLIAGLALLIISGIIYVRILRLLELKARLQQAELASRDEIGPANNHLSAVHQTIESSVANSKALVETMTRRINSYRTLAWTCGALMLFCLFGAYVLYLPAPGDNTAFSAVSLLPDANDFWKTTNIFDHLQRPAAVRLPAAPFGLYAAPPKSAPTQAFSPALRQQLGEAVSPPAPASVGSRQTEPAAAPLKIDGSVAAYTLAQIAYIENRPADAARFLPLIVRAAMLNSEVDWQRTNIMLEWTAVHGYPVSSLAVTRPYPIATIRVYVRLLFIGAVVLLMIVVTLVALIFAADKRRERIGAMIESCRKLLTPVPVATHGPP